MKCDTCKAKLGDWDDAFGHEHRPRDEFVTFACSTCLAWDKSGAYTDSGERFARCLRHAPQITPNGTEWPVTSEHARCLDWCHRR